MGKSIMWNKVLIVNVILIALVFLIFEIFLRLSGISGAMAQKDPFYGFEGTGPAFELRNIEGKAEYYVPHPNKPYIKPTFAVQKPMQTYRIFAFGGSTTEGQPYGNRGGFPFWLQDALQRKHPRIHIEVLNLGVRGFGSSRVLQLLKEAVQYESDLFVVYTGQNEFRDAHFHYWELKRSVFEARALKALLSSKTVYLIREGLLKLEAKLLGPRQTSYGGSLITRILSQPFSSETFKSYQYYSVPQLVHMKSETIGSDKESLSHRFKESTKTLLKRALRTGGMSMAENEVYDIFYHNIVQIVELAQHYNVNLIFVKKVNNLQARTVMSAIRYEITEALADPDKEQRWESEYAKGVQYLKEYKYADALSALKKVQDLNYVTDDKLLDLYLGICYEALGDYKQSVLAYERRLSERHLHLNQILEQVAKQYNVPVLDAYEVLKAESMNGIVGDNFFADSVHMRLKAYKAIGRALADLADKNKFIKEPESKAILATEQNQTVDYRSNFVEPLFHSPELDTALGWSALNQGRLDEALQLGEAAVRKDPQEIQAHLLLGYVYTKLRRFHDAESKWRSIKGLYKGKGGER